MAPKSAASAFRQYLDDAGSLPPDVLLGHVVYFTICDRKENPVTHDDLSAHFDQLGLNSVFMPHQNRPVDAFKKATSEAEDSYALPNGNRANIMIRDVSSDKERIVRHIMRETVDGERVRLEYGQIGEAIFYHAPTTSSGKRAAQGHRIRVNIKWHELHDVETEAIKALQEKIYADYDHDCQYLDGMKLRAMVRDYIKWLNAVELKPSFYFVHQTRADEIKRLQELIRRLANGSNMHTIEMIDVQAQRDEVIARFQEEAQAAVETLVKEIAQVRSTRKKITPDIVARYKGRYDAVSSKAQEYTRNFGMTQESTAAALELALDSLLDLQEKAAEDSVKPD